MDPIGVFILIAAGLLVVFSTLIAFALRYKKCPSDRILVVYGKVGGGKSARCHHGGAAFIWPIIQDYQYLDLTPLPIDIGLQGALSKQNIRVNTPSTFTVGISTEPGVMENAAERMLGLDMTQVKELAKDIIFGQMRVVIATMDIEEINADRDKLIANISMGVEVELKKVGLRLINVNVQDITDESGYIDALGQEAASKAVNEAKIKVAEANRDGEVGSAEAQRDQRVRVSEANAIATQGENVAAVDVANSNSERRTKEAEAERIAVAAEKVAQAKALQEAYTSEQKAEQERATRDKATQYANVVVPAEIEKQRIETLAEAEAQEVRINKQGEADGIRSVMEAEASGIHAILNRKAAGLNDLVIAARGNSEHAALLMIAEQMPALVAEQVKAISNLKIDKVTVWDNGKGANGKGGTADFVSSLVGSLPPLHELTKNVGVELPGYLGKMDGDVTVTDTQDDAVTSAKLRYNHALKLLEGRKASLSSFDKNNDNVIDDEELAEAASVCLDWAAKTKSKASKWYYSVDSEVHGPTTWSEVASAANHNPDMFVTYEKAKVWVPFDIIKSLA
ncbi:MAG: SPFH domain-containing protein [Verrucomicrobiota bacterium]